MAIELVVVDAFTDQPFSGNPAAVCLLEAPAPEAWMRAVAAEMNLSETAYVVSRPDGDYDLRWFTPTVEVDLCGHATLASAHVLGGAGRFHTRSGLLTALRADDGWIQMDLPSDPPEPTDPPPTLSTILGNTGREQVRAVARGRIKLLVELTSADAVRHLVPDFVAIAALDVEGLLVTAPGDEPGIDFVSRYFAPSAGIDEDPVTGSAHCVLAPWWADQLGRSRLTGRQLSRRGGTVRVEVRGDRVLVSGQAVTVSTVALQVDPPEA